MFVLEEEETLFLRKQRKLHFRWKRTKRPTCRLAQVFALAEALICLVQLSRRSCETFSFTIYTSFNLCRNCFHMISRLDICSLTAVSCSFGS
ncbi:hypothetical protein TNCV_1265461 [Trichonephila clavipes]|nr:hypothetical protein TNCV_1265461 [Trichonephila clavipes]